MKDRMCPCVSWTFSGVLEQFWLAAIPDATKDSYACQLESDPD